MAAIEEYISQIQDEELRRKISAEVRKLKNHKKFGLVFEEHLPECSPLYDVPVRRGSKVALRAGKVNEFYRVLRINGDIAFCIKKGDNEPIEIPVADLVSIAEFGEAIYPCLKPIDTVCNAPDSDLWHTLIEADNYHALQLLRYLYAGKVDCIYIDPPYNTGAKDWKYNNDYVDGVDEFRHSKWLSMMKKRLEIARDLLNPKDSVLIVTIDEKEYLHLGCLLEEMFSDARMQMVTSIINRHGSNRKSSFTRCEEYIYYIFVGNAGVESIGNAMIKEITDSDSDNTVVWKSLCRTASNNGLRKDRPNLFYPLIFSTDTGAFLKAGYSLPIDMDRSNYKLDNNQTAVWPLDKNGRELRWALQQDTFLERLSDGFVKFGKWDGKKCSCTYLTSGLVEKCKTGELTIVGYDDNGTAIVKNYNKKNISPFSLWNQSSHDAGQFGTKLILDILDTKRFSFPKSLYAVKDSISFSVINKPDALIVDFFAGSGTTLHAVNLLNAEDGGHRRCIMVTNNEVSVDEAKNLSQQGYHPGEEEWEKYGIARYVTWPRTVCSIEGHDVNGNPLKGNYIGSDLPMAEGFKANAAYFKLGFLDKNDVALGTQFKEMLPTLWMKSGAHGSCPTVDEETPDMLVLPQNRFAVLVDERKYMEFVSAVDEYPEIETVFIVTDSEVGYRDMINAFEEKDTYQLYRDYLDNFRINVARR